MLFAFASCDGTPGETSSNESEEDVKMEWSDVDGDGVIRVACIGDSITQGGETSNWPLFLGQYLEYLSTVDGNTYEVMNFGKAGAAVRHYLEDVDGDGVANEYFLYDDPKYLNSLSYNADIVIVQFGANDGLPGNAAALDDYFKSDYTTYLVQPYLDKGATVVLATPPYAKNGVVDEYVNGKISQIVRDIGKEKNLYVVDMNKTTESRMESFPDGIHGNDSGYHLIAQTYYNEIFGGKLNHVTVKTEPGASIQFGVHMTTADSEGNACFAVVDKGVPEELAGKITCKDFKPWEGTVSISEDVTLTYELTPGAYNVSSGATVTADGYFGENKPEFVVDGLPGTRWESEYRNNTWIMVDLGKSRRINGVNIVWEGAYSAHYTIEVSSDGQNFTQVADVNISKEGLETTMFDEIDARYVRINCLVRYGMWGSSIWELEVLSDIKD